MGGVRGPWRFDGERYIPGPEYIDSPPFEMPEMTEDEQREAAFNYLKNRYGSDMARAERQDALVKAWYESQANYGYHMAAEVVERLVADGLLPEGTRWAPNNDESPRPLSH